MTDIAYQPPPYGAPAPARDVTAVMGRRILAWVLDLVLYLALAVALFAAFAEYVEVPEGVGSSEACELLQDQDNDAASGCFQLDDRAYITSSSDNAVQTVASFGYFALFVVIQGVAGGSPGKLLTGLRVVDEQGSRAGVGKSAVRTLLWVVDAAPWFLPLVGFIVGLTSTGHRRIGDLAAKTYVVRAGDVGMPPRPAHGYAPPGAQAWGAPPPGWTPQQPSPPHQGQGAPTAPPRAEPSPWSGHASPPPGQPVDPAVPESIVPDISGVPGDTPAPPSTAGISREPRWDEPAYGIPGERGAPGAEPAADTGTPAEATGPTAESASPADESSPEVGVDPEWWSGPEASATSPATDAGDQPAEGTEPAAGEADTEDIPSADVSATSDWSPPTTPNADFETTDDASPTAGPAPFVAPGTDPRQETPSSPQATPAPPPQWDQARNTYIQWDPNQQMWLQWDTVANRWKLIDT